MVTARNIIKTFKQIFFEVFLFYFADDDVLPLFAVVVIYLRWYSFFKRSIKRMHLYISKTDVPLFSWMIVAK